jgi:hypothetical protein
MCVFHHPPIVSPLEETNITAAGSLYVISDVTELLFFRRSSAMSFEIKVIEDEWGLLVWWFLEYLQKTNNEVAADSIKLMLNTIHNQINRR